MLYLMQGTRIIGELDVIGPGDTRTKEELAAFAAAFWRRILKQEMPQEDSAK